MVNFIVGEQNFGVIQRRKQAKKNSLGMQLRLSFDDVKSGSHMQNPLTQELDLILLQGHLPPITFANPCFCKFQMINKNSDPKYSLRKFTCGKH